MTSYKKKTARSARKPLAMVFFAMLGVVAVLAFTLPADPAAAADHNHTDDVVALAAIGSVAVCALVCLLVIRRWY